MAKIVAERIPESQVRLNVEIGPEQMERFLERAYRRLVSRSNIPGFRKGKAPRFIVERYLGKAALVEEALDLLIPEVYREALVEQQIDAIAQPQIEITKVDEEAKEVAFQATVPVRPEVDLGAYRAIRLQRDPVEVKEGEGEAIVEQLRHQQALWEPVERPVRLGDLVTLNLEGRIGEESLNPQKELEYYVIEGTPVPVPGFAEALVGNEKDVEAEVNLTLPQDYVRPEVAGKDCSFKVTVREIKEKKLPELNDEFARTLEGGFESLEALRSKIEEGLRQRGEAEAKARLEAQVLDAVVEGAQVELPPILVEEEMDRLLQEQVEQLRRQRISLEEYLRNRERTEEQWREELRPEAQERVKRAVVLSKVGEVEQITVSPEEVEAESERIAARSSERADEMRRFMSQPSVADSIYRHLFTHKVLDRLVTIATGEAETPVAGMTRGEGGALEEAETGMATEDISSSGR